MRKILYTVCRVVELIANVGLIGVFFLCMSIMSALCQYVPSFAEGYSKYFQMLNEHTGYNLLVLAVLGTVFCTLKMVFANMTQLDIGLMKSFIPALVAGVLYFISTPVSNFVFEKLKTNMPYANSTVEYLVLFWVCLMIIFVKKIVNSSDGIKVKTKLSESNEIALKYFDGNLKGCDLAEAEVIALKYIGGDDYE